MEVVLNSEILEEGHTAFDGFLNEIPFEIKGIEGKSNRIIRDKIFDASKKGAEIVVIYYITVQTIKKIKSSLKPIIFVFANK
jgi:hypothetical protein